MPLFERVLSRDPLRRKTTTFHFDPYTDELTIATKQDVTQLVDTNKAFFNETPNDWRKSEMHRVASIPVALLPELEKRGIMSCAGEILDERALSKWLNDPDNRFFRTREGRV